MPGVKNALQSVSLSVGWNQFPVPRHTAILADEMGLGKTMQAITAVRLLLHAGHVRNVLLICPKPLVTNWTRNSSSGLPKSLSPSSKETNGADAGNGLFKTSRLCIANYEALLTATNSLTGGSTSILYCWMKRSGSRTVPAVRINWFVRCHGLVVGRLTGTPIENTPDDLVGISQFLSTGRLKTGMSPRQLREATRDLYPASDEGPSSDRNASQAFPRTPAPRAIR